MFTGLIQDIGRVDSIQKDGDWRIVIKTGFDMAKHDIGASIACSGCCLTVVEKDQEWFAVDVSAESLSKTIIADWVVVTRVNLEPSLRLGDELGGHIVSGHVDGLGEVLSIEVVSDCHKVLFKAPEDLKALIAVKGSMTINGVSLTVNQVRDAEFSVNIIPHTWQQTCFQYLKIGDKVHLEVDMLARYIARYREVIA